MLENPQDFIVNALFEKLPIKHPSFTIERRIDFIQKAAEPSAAMVHETLKQLFAKPLRESHRILITEEGESTIQKLADKYVEMEFTKIKTKDPEVKKQLAALRNISSLYFVLQALSANEDDATFYGGVATNLETMIAGKAADVDIILARILEMVARKGKVNRFAGFYLTTVFAPAFTQEQLTKLAEVSDLWSHFKLLKCYCRLSKRATGLLLLAMKRERKMMKSLHPLLPKNLLQLRNHVKTTTVKMKTRVAKTMMRKWMLKMMTKVKKTKQSFLPMKPSLTQKWLPPFAEL